MDENLANLNGSYQELGCLKWAVKLMKFAFEQNVGQSNHNSRFFEISAKDIAMSV